MSFYDPTRHPPLPDRTKLFRDTERSRTAWGPRPATVTPEPAGPGEESVWDYPRPPEIRTAPAPARIIFDGKTVAETDRALRICETASAPVYYFPPDLVDAAMLRPADGLSVCEWKGAAIYFDLVAGDRRSEQAAFSYPDPFDVAPVDFSAIAGWIGFYPGRVDAAFVGDERAANQPGGLYAGWVTPDIKGPIKGGPGAGGW